jgi:hypothetical protein
MARTTGWRAFGIAGPLLGLALPVLAEAGVPAGTSAASAGASAEPSEVRFTVGESALLDCLRAAMPQTLSVGTKVLGTELTLLDPSDLVLRDGKARFKIRVKGRTLPVDQVVQPTVTIDRDPQSGRYYGVVSSLPIQIPGLGALDLRDYLPRFEIPAVVENLYRVSDRPLGLRLRIRRIAILDHLLEVAADLDFAPVVSSRPPEQPPSGDTSPHRRRS